MKKKSSKKQTIQYESVKLKKDIVDKIRECKKETKIPIGSFFELAAEEKLSSFNKDNHSKK